MAAMPLNPERLLRRCDPKTLPFETTAQLDDFADAAVQTRALDAIRFGVEMPSDGYNLFVMGPTGVGKHTLTQRLLQEKANNDPVPSDWCYVHNFKEPHAPCAIALSPGQGTQFRDDMQGLVEDLQGAITAAFESEDYQRRLQELEEAFKERQETMFEKLAAEAAEQGIRLLRTPAGFVFAPIKNGEVLGPDEFARLPAEEQEGIKHKIEAFQGRMQELMRGMLQSAKESREKVRQLNRDVALAAVGHLIDELKAKYSEHSRLTEYFEAVRADVLDNLAQFRRAGSEAPAPAVFGGGAIEQAPVDRYAVNVIVDHGAAEGAPVVTENHPSYQNLVGRIEQRAQMGMLVTDFTLIKPGALHRANGGYLLLDARKVLLQPFAWEALKMSLEAGEIRIESLGQMLSLVSTVSLEPEHIPLEAKVVLVGDRFLYYLLHSLDPDFKKLFKVSADFEERIDRDTGNDGLYARLIASIARRHELRHLDRGAVARVIEEGARRLGDAEKLSTQVGDIADLLREASFWAGKGGREIVSAEDVEQAIEMKQRRVDRVRRRVQEEIQRDTILIDTEGERVAQINGLSVLDLGEFRFGQPSRITATARAGRGGIVDIEREVKLGGPFHSKGVLILSSLLASRYAKEKPLSLSASLVFEQSYGQVDGDSASVAETCALLSALSELPIKQCMAVTGSINQHGDVQPIGGVNEKIEGFFDVCAQRGLNGSHGVVIPESNVKHLMLRHDIVAAAEAGRFSVYAVKTIDEAIEILTDVPAGIADASGRYPEGTLNARVQHRLEALYEKQRELAAERRAGDGVTKHEADSDPE